MDQSEPPNDPTDLEAFDHQDCRPGPRDLDSDLLADVVDGLEQAGMPMRHIEHGGALFRGHARAWPREVYSLSERRWLPYAGELPKAATWGSFISDEQAATWIARDGGEPG